MDPEPFEVSEARIRCGDVSWEGLTRNLEGLAERLRAWAQNEEMVDQYSTQHGRDCLAAADALASPPSTSRADAPCPSPAIPPGAGKPSSGEGRQTCIWTLDPWDENEIWETQCGQSFVWRAPQGEGR
jgi:hypothetical protein